MTGRTAPSATPVDGNADAPAPAVPEVLAGVTAPEEEIKRLRAELAAATAKATAARKAASDARKAAAAKPTARDYVRAVDAAILSYVPSLIAGADVPEELRAEVAQLVANQLHHLSTPERGWPAEMPKPARSDWK